MATSNKLLPAGYTPGDHDIIIGRGKSVKTHTANVKFSRLVASIAVHYQAAASKGQKGAILSKLIHDMDAGFIKRDLSTGRWMRVNEDLARTTAAQAIRNHLSEDYRSSKQFKSMRRLQQIQKQQQSEQQMQQQIHCISPSPSLSGMRLNNVEADVRAFHLLYSVFGSRQTQDDPFLPTPIAEKKTQAVVTKNTAFTR